MPESFKGKSVSSWTHHEHNGDFTLRFSDGSWLGVSIDFDHPCTEDDLPTLALEYWDSVTGDTLTTE